MATKRLSKSKTEVLNGLIAEFSREHGGHFRMEDVTAWIVRNERIPLPRVDPGRLLTISLKQAARRRRIRDAQGRTVRELIAAKIDRVDPNGNHILDVVWDFLHSTSRELAYRAFSQRDESIEKQRLAATREVHSFLENNPNAVGNEEQFQFAFMLEDATSQTHAIIAESEVGSGHKTSGSILTKAKPR